MVKQKSGAQLHVGDGAGGMIAVQDLRFDKDEWSVRLRIPARLAQEWMAQLGAECELRAYSTAGLSQLGSDENSGTLQIRNTNSAATPVFDLIWERARDQTLVVRARHSGDLTPPIADLRTFLASVTRATRSKRRVRQHRRAYLVVHGLPWSGDLWLSPQLCLGPPSLPAPYSNDPQMIVVDAMVEGIGSAGVTDEFHRQLRELTVFLDVVMNVHAVEQRQERVWTFETDDQGHYKHFELRPSAYYEPELHPRMPVPGIRPAMPTHPVARPGIEGPPTIAQMQTRSAPQDTSSLWQKLQSLPEALQRQFLEAGNAYRNAQSCWPDQRTAYASFLVVACEALKPARKRFDNANVYDVVKSLQGSAEATALRALESHPQEIRSGHFHRGRLVDGELTPKFGTDYFQDPSFDHLIRALHVSCRVCLIEWLRRSGNYTLQWMPRPRPPWRARLRRAISALRGAR